jgi:pimeloyl-ACP methyl ester carboxylesterase
MPHLAPTILYDVTIIGGGLSGKAASLHLAGFLGAWRLMSVLRFGDPAPLLAVVPEMLPHLAVPTLIFHGAHDKALPEVFAQRASALIPQSKMIVVDSGHFIPLSNPEIVATELGRFFAGAPAA